LTKDISINSGLGYRQFKNHLYTIEDIKSSYGYSYSHDVEIRTTDSRFYWPIGIAYDFHPTTHLAVSMHLEHDLVFSGNFDAMTHNKDESLTLTVDQNSGHTLKVNMDISQKNLPYIINPISPTGKSVLFQTTYLKKEITYQKKPGLMYLGKSKASRSYRNTFDIIQKNRSKPLHLKT